KSEVNRADKIATEARLLQRHGKAPLPESRCLAQGFIGKRVKHYRGRWLHLRVWCPEQKVKIDETRSELAGRLETIGVVEGELALEELRMTVGMHREIEIRKLGP